MPFGRLGYHAREMTGVPATPLTGAQPGTRDAVLGGAPARGRSRRSNSGVGVDDLWSSSTSDVEVRQEGQTDEEGSSSIG